MTRSVSHKQDTAHLLQHAYMKRLISTNKYFNCAWTLLIDWE
jgi:hypothetical protein